MLEVDLHEDTKRVVIRHLMKETGIQEVEARVLVETVGLNWLPLVREVEMRRVLSLKAASRVPV